MTRNSGSPTSTFPGGDYKQSGALGLGFGSVGRVDLLVEAGVPVISFSGHRLSIQQCPCVIPDTVHLFLHVRVTFVGSLSILWIFALEKQPFASAFFSIVFLFSSSLPPSSSSSWAPLLAMSSWWRSQGLCSVSWNTGCRRFSSLRGSDLMRVFSSAFTCSSPPPNFLSDPQAVQKHAGNFHMDTVFPLAFCY